MKSKIIILIFVVVILLLSSVGVVQANKNKVSDVKLDSIVSAKIDYRFTSYDNRFMYDKVVVINKDSLIIGELILYTNKKELDSFYNSNNNWKKTRLYTNIKNGSLRMIEKPIN